MKENRLGTISLLIGFMLLLPIIYGPLQYVTANPPDKDSLSADAYALKWTFSNKRIEGTPRVGPDGSIYFYLLNGTFCALNSDGKIQWTYNVNRTPYAYTFSPTGSVYVFSDALYSLNPDGSLKWSLAIENPEKKTPTMLVSQNGVLYLVLYDIYAISSEGHIEWKYPASSGGPFYPGVLANNSVIAGSDTNNTVVALDFEGNCLWSQEINRSVADVFFSDKGVILVKNYGNQLYAFSISGTPLWNRSFPEGVQIAPDGQIYAIENSEHPRYHVLNPQNGEEVWNFSAAYVEFRGNNTTLAFTYDGTIYSLNSNGEIQWKYGPTGEYIPASSVLINDEGVIFLVINPMGSSTCMLYASDPNGEQFKLVATPSAWVGSPIGFGGRSIIYFFWLGDNTITAYEADSDSDGVVNSRDFLPNFDNNLFYFLIIILLLALLIVTSVVWNIKNERRKSREDYVLSHEEDNK